MGSPLLLAIASSLLAGVSAGGAPVSGVGPPQSVTDADSTEARPPPGSREDRALWRSAYEQYGGSQMEVERSRTMIVELRTGAYHERLAAAGKATGAEQGKRAEELWTRLAAAGADAYEASSKPPFNLRTGCRYELLRFGQAMGAKPGDPGGSDLPVFREKLRVCRDRIDAFVKPLVKANDRLSALLDEARTFLGSGPTGASAPVKPAAAPPPGG